jgi:hypothetical protein
MLTLLSHKLILLPIILSFGLFCRKIIISILNFFNLVYFMVHIKSYKSISVQTVTLFKILSNVAVYIYIYILLYPLK